MAGRSTKGVVDTTPITKHVVTYDELLAQTSDVSESIQKSDRPSAIATVGGDIEPIELGKLRKSASPTIRMGIGVDPHKVVENDWNDYKLYMSRNKF